MKKICFSFFSVMFIMIWVVGIAYATPVFNVRPVNVADGSSGHSSWDGAGKTMFDFFKGNLGYTGTAPSGTPAGIDAKSDQLKIATFLASHAVSTLLLEIAGYSGANIFGLYENGKPSNKITMFNGPASPFTSSDLTFTSVLGGYEVRINGSLKSTWTTNQFGFFLAPNGSSSTFYYSDDLLNPKTTEFPDGTPQMLIYNGSKAWGDQGSYYVAIEDLKYSWINTSCSDADFNDMVVKFTPSATPEPGTLILLSSGLVGLFGYTKLRLTRKKA